MKDQKIYLLTITLLVFLLVAQVAFGVTVGPNSASVAANDATVGTIAWGQIDQAYASDDSRARANLAVGEVSNYLVFTGFGFAIPAGSTIDGIEVIIEKRKNGGSIKDNSVRLLKGGVFTGDDKAQLAFWPGTDFLVPHGGAADLWGAAWTEADINDPNFGVAVSIINSSAGGAARWGYIDHITISVSYTPGVVLPIELTSFDVQREGDAAEITWTTANEINNDYFSIERSQDGTNFESIAIIDGAGSSNSKIDYSYTDYMPFDGNSYYRLVQTDLTGETTTSKVVLLKGEAVADLDGAPVRIYPNPITGDQGFNIQFGAVEELNKEVLVVLYDITGKTIYSKVVLQGQNGSTISINPNKNLQNGIYLVVGSNSDELIFRQKLVVADHAGVGSFASR